MDLDRLAQAALEMPMLTRTQRDTFAADGYLVLRQLCDEAVLEPVRQLIARYVDGQSRCWAPQFH